MENLTNINVIKDLMSQNGFTFSKAMGQNFLINPSVCPKMAELCGADEHSGVLEIGPGIGVLTNEIAKTAKKVVAVELDKRLFPILNKTLEEHSNVKIVNSDILKIDLHEFIKNEFTNMDLYVCANLPYYITSPIIMKFLEEKVAVNAMTLMVQKEVAEKICANPGERKSGAITAAVHYYCKPEILFNVSSGSFMPAPKVDSAVIKLNIHEKSPYNVEDEQMFFKIVKASFSMRRKTILNSISAGMSINKENVKNILESINVLPSLRAEALTMQDFVSIANAFSYKLKIQDN